jgi:hypothetical protein
MQRRTLDYLFAIGGVMLAGLLAVLGFVLTSNANFAHDYVRDQLSEQRITFPADERLTDEEKASACVVDNAGLALTSGKQAECYANDYIGLHVQGVADGKTYAELGPVQFGLRADVEKAKADNAANLTELQTKLDTVNTQRDTLFKGETLRGLLLTSFGFSEFGRKADQAATVAFISAGIVTLLSIAGFMHAFRTPKDVGFSPTMSNGVMQEPKMMDRPERAATR